MNAKESVFDIYHPFVAFISLISVMCLTVFTLSLPITVVSLLGACVFFVSLYGAGDFFKTFAYLLPFFLVITVTNPLFSHNGITVLFFLNGLPITLESLLYGAELGAMMLAVIVWGRCFSAVMTSDKILLLIGSLFPTTALTISIVLRNIPLFKKRWREIVRGQKTMGYYSDDSLMTRLRGSIKAFSALVTFAIESAVDSGASMMSRGYKTGRRTSYKRYTFHAKDIFMVVAVAMLDVLLAVLMAITPKTVFYPTFSGVGVSLTDICLYTVFALLVFLPVGLEITEKLRWTYYRSKI